MKAILTKTFRFYDYDGSPKGIARPPILIKEIDWPNNLPPSSFGFIRDGELHDAVHSTGFDINEKNIVIYLRPAEFSTNNQQGLNNEISRYKENGFKDQLSE